VYKKLRLLVDRGCFFVGHGLKKDFRMISRFIPLQSLVEPDPRYSDIFVPPDNVLDTVDIYFVQARHRRLSLRFLSWFVLDEQIQADAHDGHNSIEDARAALHLWLAFQRFEAEGVWVRKLEEIYREGKQYVRTRVLRLRCVPTTEFGFYRTTSRPLLKPLQHQHQHKLRRRPYRRQRHTQVPCILGQWASHRLLSHRRPRSHHSPPSRNGPVAVTVFSPRQRWARRSPRHLALSPHCRVRSLPVPQRSARVVRPHPLGLGRAAA
jgi:hypothetical protein